MSVEDNVPTEGEGSCVDGASGVRGGVVDVHSDRSEVLTESILEGAADLILHRPTRGAEHSIDEW
jgi:hypothetical protein